MGIVRAAEDVEAGVAVVGAAAAAAGGEVTAPLLQSVKIQDGEVAECRGGGSLRMVLLSTAVAVCGSFVFGTCVGYSAPTESGIVDEVGLSIAEFAIFGSILTIGAMIGAVTSGRLADFLGRKMTMRISAIICIFGWLSIHLAKSAIMLYFGRILLGFSTGVLSYVCADIGLDLAGACVYSRNSTKESQRGPCNFKSVVDLLREFSYLHNRSAGFMAQFGSCRFSALYYPASWAFLHSRVPQMAGQCWKGERISDCVAKAAWRECRHI